MNHAKAEIARAGPVACSVDSDALLDYTGEGVVVDPVGERTYEDTDHVLEVVGWGEEAGVPCVLFPK